MKGQLRRINPILLHLQCYRGRRTAAQSGGRTRQSEQGPLLRRRSFHLTKQGTNYPEDDKERPRCVAISSRKGRQRRRRRIMPSVSIQQKAKNSFPRRRHCRECPHSLCPYSSLILSLSIPIPVHLTRKDSGRFLFWGVEESVTPNSFGSSLY